MKPISSKRLLFEISEQEQKLKLYPPRPSIRPLSFTVNNSFCFKGSTFAGPEIPVAAKP